VDVEPAPEVVQPEKLPDVVPEMPSSPPLETVSLGGVYGADGGVDGGLEGGVPGSVLNGLRGGGGTPGGVPDGVPGGEGAGTPIVPGPDVTPPELLRKVQPDYPEIARQARLSGKVIVRAVINELGQVEDATVLQASSDLFVDASIAAVREWKYRPALQNGQPISVYFTIVVVFELR
jgi:protein TonB